MIGDAGDRGRTSLNFPNCQTEVVAVAKEITNNYGQQRRKGAMHPLRHVIEPERPIYE